MKLEDFFLDDLIKSELLGRAFSQRVLTRLLLRNFHRAKVIGSFSSRRVNTFLFDALRKGGLVSALSVLFYRLFTEAFDMLPREDVAFALLFITVAHSIDVNAGDDPRLKVKAIMTRDVLRVHLFLKSHVFLDVRGG